MASCFVLCLLFVMVTLTASSAVSRGIKQRISEEGVNRVIKDFIKTELHPYILKYEDRHTEFNIPLFGNTIHISNLSAIDVINLHGRADIKFFNVIAVSFGFDRFSLDADITLVSKNNNTPRAVAPTILHFLDASLDVIVQLGPGNDTDGINISECNVKLKEFDAEGEIAPQLRGFFALAHTQVATLVAQVCPMVKNKLQTKLQHILIIHESMTFVSSDGKSAQAKFHTNTITTSEDYFEVIALVDDEPPLPVIFPPTPGNKRELVEWFSTPLIDYMFNATYQEIFQRFQYDMTMSKTSYAVDTTTESVDSDVLLTVEGASLLLRSTGHMINLKSPGHYSRADCITVWANLAAVIPYSIAVNDVNILISADIDRLQINYAVMSWNGSCTLPEDKRLIDEMQHSIMKKYNSEFEKILKATFITVELPSDDMVIGFKDVAVELIKDAVGVTCNLRIGPVTTPTKTKRTITRNTLFTRKYIYYKLTTGTEIVGPDNSNGADNLKQLAFILVLALLLPILI